MIMESSIALATITKVVVTRSVFVIFLIATL